MHEKRSSVTCLYRELLQPQVAGADAVEDEAALDAELAGLRGSIAEARLRPGGRAARSCG